MPLVVWVQLRARDLSKGNGDGEGPGYLFPADELCAQVLQRSSMLQRRPGSYFYHRPISSSSIPLPTRSFHPPSISFFLAPLDSLFLRILESASLGRVSSSVAFDVCVYPCMFPILASCVLNNFFFK
mmetsp:Transcript_21174/g.31033  ORF Transcript_21174/g.31033 Transcript_21174/m.31033 type:complete len:127 (-) Transcript_21174:41-421(-)